MSLSPFAFMTGEIRWLFWSLPFIDQSLIIFRHKTSTNTALLLSHILKLPTVFFPLPFQIIKACYHQLDKYVAPPGGNHLDMMREILLSQTRKETESPLLVVCSQPAGIVFLRAIDSLVRLQGDQGLLSCWVYRSLENLLLHFLHFPPPCICFRLLSPLYLFLPVFHHP